MQIIRYILYGIQFLTLEFALILVFGMTSQASGAQGGLYSVTDWNRKMSCSANSLNLLHLRFPKDLKGSFVENSEIIYFENGEAQTFGIYCQLKVVASVSYESESEPDASAVIPPKTIFEVIQHRVTSEEKCIPSQIKTCPSDLLTDQLVNICNNTYVSKNALILQPQCRTERVETLVLGYKGRHEALQELQAEWNEKPDSDNLLQLECRYRLPGEEYQSITKEFGYKPKSGATDIPQELNRNLVLYPKGYYERSGCGSPTPGGPTDGKKGIHNKK